MDDVLLQRPHLFLDGGWVAPQDPSGGGCAEVVEAATEQVMGTVALAGPADIDRAVVAAQQALRGPWGTLTTAERSTLVGAFAGELKRRGRDAARLVSRENGMPTPLSAVVNGIAPYAITGYYAHLGATLTDSDVRPSPTGGDTVVLRRPVGVVAAVTPWNYPLALAVMKIAPALVAGCTVVLKPPPETGLDAHLLSDAAVAAGLPSGVLQVLPGGREAGAHLVAHPGVAKVAFTGSTAAGRAIGETAGRMLRPVTLELGGKSVSLIAEDADLDLVLGKLHEISLPNNGQTCHAATRILAPRSRYAEVVDGVTATVASLVVGDPLDPATQIGPLVSRAQRDRVLELVRAGAGEGRVTTGGGAPDRAGWFVEPTVVADLANDALLAREELFGPVLAVIPYDDEDHAVALANDSAYGLGGVVWSADAERGFDLAQRIESGTVGVNHYELHLNAPFGGVKDSGLGRELGPEGLAPYQQLTSIYRR